MANRNPPQSPPRKDQFPNQMRIGIEIPLDPDMPDLELTPSPVAGDDGSDIFLGDVLPRGCRGSGRVGESNKFYDGRSWFLR